MLNKILDTLRELPVAKGNPIFEKEMIEEATTMYNAGWDALEDGMFLQERGSQVAIKRGNKIVVNEMDEKSGYCIHSGKVTGKVLKEVREIEVPNDKKESYLAQIIINRFYTIEGVN